ncbi:MAG: ribonuclease E inhibitor RraB [Candidatus Dormibacteraeota bacterium]|nr:ribonuclease E inhibitor RraB [Candidatus Dormibacteraeota bacterium]MBO0744547.1 ribonuclease E inhibitor RraB [Candidatus Dormibacteraeota bacterium]
MEDLFALVIPRSLLKRRKPPRVSLAEPSPEDLAQIEELRIQGSRLKVPHPVRVFVRFEQEKAAREASEFFAKEGFRCSLRAEAADRWTVIGVISLVPDPKVITWLREQMGNWTKELDGTYLGWDAPIVA